MTQDTATDSQVNCPETYYQRTRALEEMLREETKETLLLHVASSIMIRCRYYLGLTGAEMEAAIAAEVAEVRKWRDNARLSRLSRRADRFLQRLEAGEFSKPRQRKRRRKAAVRATKGAIR